MKAPGWRWLLLVLFLSECFCVRRHKSTFTGHTVPIPPPHRSTSLSSSDPSSPQEDVVVEEIAHETLSKEGIGREEEEDSYSEYILLRTLGDEKKERECNIYSHFHFTMTTSFPVGEESLGIQPSSSTAHSSSSFSHGTKPRKTDFELFPGSLGGVVQLYDVEEFHLSFTSGRWPTRFPPPVLPAPHGGMLPSSHFSSSIFYTQILRIFSFLLFLSYLQLNYGSSFESNIPIEKKRVFAMCMTNCGGVSLNRSAVYFVHLSRPSMSLRTPLHFHSHPNFNSMSEFMISPSVIPGQHIIFSLYFNVLLSFLQILQPHPASHAVWSDVGRASVHRKLDAIPFAAPFRETKGWLRIASESAEALRHCVPQHGHPLSRNIAAQLIAVTSHREG
jgi:hypothetical protein